MALNIFEPRYRLMVRRCMEGARRFGMATVGPAHELHPIACECEILECQPQPDGCAALILDSPTLSDAPMVQAQAGRGDASRRAACSERGVPCSATPL